MNYLYNGVELPALPEWDKVAYPYAAIGKHTYTDGVVAYFFVARNTPLTAYQDSGNIVFIINAPVVYRLQEGASEWGSRTTVGVELAYIWSNHDLYAYEDSTVLVHRASTPISLEGMKVIEWDGDLSGLAELDSGRLWTWYRVGDSLTDLSSIGALVVSQDGESFVIPDAQLALDETLGMFTVASEVMGSVIGFAEVILNVTVDTDGIPEGLYFASVPADVLETGGSGHISLFAYTPTPKTILSLDHTALTQGWIVGKRLAAMRAKRKPVAYLYNGVRLPALPEWDEEKYPYVALQYLAGEGSTIYVIGYSEKPTTSIQAITKSVVHGVDTGVSYITTYYYEPEGWYSDAEESANGHRIGIDNFIWANYDILNTDGTTYLAASDPVPVYE